MALNERISNRLWGYGMLALLAALLCSLFFLLGYRIDKKKDGPTRAYACGYQWGLHDSGFAPAPNCSRRITK